MRLYLMEFIGTFFLVFTVVMSVHFNAVPGLAIGAVLMSMVYIGGAISGGHYNPGISLGIALRGRLAFGTLIAYWISQILGAIAAALIAMVLVGHADTPGVPALAGPAMWRGLLAEFVFAFALVLSVLTTATAKKTAGNSYFGLAIGFVVGAGVFAVGSISGAAFNSGVGLGICLAGLSAWSNLWIYIVANLLAGVVASGAFRFMSPEEHAPATA